MLISIKLTGFIMTNLSAQRVLPEPFEMRGVLNFWAKNVEPI